MRLVRNLYESIKKFCITYPSAFSLCIICGYIFICILPYLVLKKEFIIHTTDIFNSLISLLFMCLLSIVFVNIIKAQTKLHESKKNELITEREEQIRQAQLKTMQEVARGLQHHINNPLSIIMLALGNAHKAASGNPKLIHQLDTIDEEVNRIITSLSDFAKVRTYTVESVDSTIGDIATRSINL